MADKIAVTLRLCDGDYDSVYNTIFFQADVPNSTCKLKLLVMLSIYHYFHLFLLLIYIYFYTPVDCATTSLFVFNYYL